MKGRVHIHPCGVRHYSGACCDSQRPRLWVTGEIREKPFHVFRVELPRMPLAMEQYEALDPVYISIFSSDTVMRGADAQQLRGVFHGSAQWWLQYVCINSLLSRSDVNNFTELGARNPFKQALSGVYL